MPRFSYLRRLMILPIAVMIISSLAFVVTEDNNSGKTVVVPSKPEKQDTIPALLTGDDEVFIFVEDPPRFVGGDAAMKKYLTTTIMYPAEAIKHNISGTVFVNFIVSKEGELKAVRTVGAKKGGGLEEEAIRVVKAMPKWLPGKQNHRLVNVQYNLPVNFKLAGEIDKPAEENNKPDRRIADDGTFLEVDQPPVFPGGMDGLMAFLSKNVRYPKSARRQNLSGVVRVGFDVKADGTISNIHNLEEAIGGGLDEEAIRVVNKMPKWHPGREKGVAVPVRMVLPISFKGK